MIYYLLLLCLPLLSCCQSIAQKQYSLKVARPHVILFSAVTTLIALCFFLITSGLQLAFDGRLLPYALGFGLCYASAWVGTVMAVRYGLMSISTLIISCSLVFPTVYGVLLGDSLGVPGAIGLALLLAALVLVNLQFKEQGKFSLKWLGWVLAAFLGNGGCGVLQNMQKRALGESYSHEFMILSLGVAFIALMACAWLSGCRWKKDLTACLPYAGANGLANAAMNLTLLLIIGHIPNTILYPTDAALCMLFTFLVSFLFYKERFTLPQYIGYGLGAAAIVMLNIG